ncbi:MAG: EamA family transporter [Chloroflexi bacterium]|nr:EamA family transporter [Chloroflexota bacterium]
MSAFLFIALSTLFGVCGQLALKQGMTRLSATFSGSGASLALLSQMARSIWVVGGLAGYGTGVLFWLAALSRLDASYLYPFASLSYVGIVIGSYFWFKEKINRTRLIGIAIVILGVLFTSLS